MRDEGVVTAEFGAWRNKARDMIVKGIAPQSAEWSSGLGFTGLNDEELKPVASPKVPSEFFKMAALVACARDEDRWSLLYRILYRLNHENPNLLKVSVDSDVRRAEVLAKSVSRDIHKMHAFVRFKKVDIEGVETYVAWHKPEHLIIELGTPFFVRRFGDKPWSIFTSDASAHWDLKKLTFTEGIPQNEFHHSDSFDEVWKTYYKSIYNPARLKIKMMKSEMAPKYWSSMPEAEIIYDLIRETPKRLQNMAEEVRYQAVVPPHLEWSELKEKAMGCTACPLAAHASKTVFGEGNLDAEIMIVGEQPGDNEDVEGKSFVGPAGKILNEALAEAGLARESVYVTNAVKHFKWTTDPRNPQLRKHSKASGTEMQACKPWLEAEIARVKPKLIIALGATAGTALFGRLVKIQSERGKIHHESPFAKNLMISWHPAAILRANTPEEHLQRKQELITDLRAAVEAVTLKT